MSLIFPQKYEWSAPYIPYAQEGQWAPRVTWSLSGSHQEIKTENACKLNQDKLSGVLGTVMRMHLMEWKLNGGSDLAMAGFF